MADQRSGGIGWTDETWNPVRGCSRVSEGCRHCYAEAMALRCYFMDRGNDVPIGQGRYDGLIEMVGGEACTAPFSPWSPLGHRSVDGKSWCSWCRGLGRVGGEARWTGAVRLVPERLADPLHWRRSRRIFVNSMSDLFHDALSNEQIYSVFDVMVEAHWHTFQVLTKRAERMRDWVVWWLDQGSDHSTGYVARMPPNIWLGVSVEDQKAADERIPLLLQTPAAVRFVSCEPMLGPVDFTCIPEPGRGTPANALVDWRKPFMRPPVVTGARLDLVIFGGENGPRPCDLAWIRAGLLQCRDAGVAAFVKQLGSHPVEYHCASGSRCTHPDCGNRMPRPRDRAGADPAEWPDDLRVREFPAVTR